MIQDHCGNTYACVQDMCKHYNITEHVYYHRQANKWSLEKTLITPMNKRRKAKDHTGKTYPSIRAMCDAWGINTALYYGRLKCGYSIEEALTAPLMVQPRNSKLIIDHEGNQFPSVRQLCQHWNIGRSTYNARIKNGWSIEKALTTPCKEINSTTKQHWIDPLGNHFESLAAMCEHYNISHHTFRARIKDHNWTLAEALNIIPRVNHKSMNQRIDKDLTILQNIKNNENQPTNYYEVDYKNEKFIMSHNAILRYCTCVLRKE